MKLSTQLHITSYDTMREEVTPVKNRKYMRMIHKPEPQTGMWTSTYDKEIHSGWVEWCKYADFEPYTKQWYLLTPKEDARIYVIDSLADLLYLMEKYPHEVHLDTARIHRKMIAGNDYAYSTQEALDCINADIDFERLALDYDVLHLTDDAAGALHLTFPIDLNSWDCESTLWFRWCFASVQKIEPPVREEAL